jgi:CheY-like chemotaxis protein
MSSVRTNSSRRRTRSREMSHATHTLAHKSPQRGRSARPNVTLLPQSPALSIDSSATIETIEHPNATHASAVAQSQPHILIVEDDPCAAHAIRDTLTLEGEPHWNIQVAEGGERALALAAARPPNVVLLDVGLPDLDGAEVYRRLRTHPRMGGTHVLFLTAATSLDLYQRGVDAGVVLRKPFEMRELVGLVRTLVAS